MDYVIADKNRMCVAYLDSVTSLDIDVGDTNDFELILSRSHAKHLGVCRGFWFFCPATEFGGMIEETRSSTSSDEITYMGYTWRGYLQQLIIQPPAGQDYLIVSGDANRILEKVLSVGTGRLFTVPEEDSGITVNNYRFRYETALDGLTKMLTSKKARIDIKAIEGSENEPSKVMIQAVKTRNYSEEIQYDGDDNINVSIRDFGRGINHMICLGQGELSERTVRHLYVQLDGSIGQKQYYKGTSERTAVYDFSSVTDVEELIKGGTDRLKSLMNYKSAEMSIAKADLEIGDIVSARDRNAGIVLSRPVINKILTYINGEESIGYKLKGEK